MASVLIYNTEDILKNVGNQTVSGPPYTGKKKILTKVMHYSNGLVLAVRL